MVAVWRGVMAAEFVFFVITRRVATASRVYPACGI